MSESKEQKHKPQRPAGTSGYAEPQPVPKRGGKAMPDANTPHEPQNTPQRKPKPSS